MRRASWVALLGLFCLGWVGTAAGWEFQMTGEAEWRYRYISRWAGPHDLFGNAEIAQHTFRPQPPGSGWMVTSIGLPGPNEGYVQLEGYSAKGSDASYGEMRLWVYPDIKINEAIRVRSSIRFQGNLNGRYERGFPFWASNPHYNGWIMAESRDLVTGMGIAAPILDTFWGTIVLPWGTLVAGRRPAGFGMGWVVHEENSCPTSIALITSYGPLRFAFSQYFPDSGSYTDPNDQEILHVNAPPGHSVDINSAVDKNEVRDWNQAVAVTYQAGNVDMGAMFRFIRQSDAHYLNPMVPGYVPGVDWIQGSLRDDATASFNALFLAARHWSAPFTPIYGDLFFLLHTSYFKYVNNRFFFNGEYDFQFIEARRKGGHPLSGFPQAWALEGGFWAGPLKVSLAHFYRSGHDRRGGLFRIMQATGFNAFTGAYVYDKWHHFISIWGSGERPITPYEFLLGLYGAGNNSYGWRPIGQCTFEDFSAVAGRVDLAVAANLNVFASLIRANRASNTATPVGLYNGFNDYFGSNPFPVDGLVYPNVPDTDLGWEVDAGMDWKLLEGLTFKVLAAYWQPGRWFNWAYRDMTFWIYDLVNGEPILDGTVNPGRDIDAIFALQTNILLEF